ncbi:ROK family protein [Mycoplasma sp. M5725]|uniref:ROK family protein n=1 Tax=Mycoplasma phocimorsus TaxID=3045839 RepID=A0AAJ1UX01_9MOLU|nr:ROK family protein [Mycoplasma phocimorsus]MDJ1645865.1 ROK family protein [Mycoplasma phocimorsus]MDJ1646409.1 ROK family protein [Mycoplasma phocimorsus]MDJ1649108.1 ROK family protein [Mycoplasma phocimorsus]
MIKRIAAVDIGGTNTRFALFEGEKIILKERFSTEPVDWKKTLDEIVELCDTHKVESLGLCFPGPADYKNGNIILTPNLPGWTNLNIKKYILENSKTVDKIECENDANVMGLANHHFFGKGRGDVTQFFTISTGLGAGLVIDNKIFTGSYGLGQEIARAPLGSVYDSKTYHLLPFSVELYASGAGLKLRAKTKGLDLDAKEIFEKYSTNDICRKLIDEGIDSLARTIATSVAFLNPNLFVFGGSVARKNRWFVQEAIQLAKTYSAPEHFHNVDFKFEELGDDSALFGLFHLVK